ncbi:MAG: bifunctional phosphoribosyl-AMP cyclohydrolase/phosphoribosyl-ATP diphosphatase HisIE [Chloroflexota bacterium]|nr:bifunctional phosphoribosyl-AMP cyclohydrolase/phosphoribosyl-ATP diphosphatase HisIE [Chloroflexota bacterium]MDE2969059.1 bifunctional phosphoribosyl-AMP cyclohydrolase/phosphoribosyl-ATP diphosphatase HisIE [Chloroflexota bacterium]
MTIPLRRNENGLIPAIAQHHETGQVLMLAYVSAESLARTLQDGDAWFYSRSRQSLWHKGEESGNYLRVKSLQVDCDGDTVLMKVDPVGPACHTGAVSCFFNDVDAEPTYAESDAGVGVLEELFAVIKDRQANPTAESYTAKLLQSGVGRVAQKVVEEAGESAIAAAQGEKEALAGEVADLLYHTLTLLAAAEVSPRDVWAELAKRRK